MDRVCMIVGPQKRMIMVISTAGLKLVSSGENFGPKDSKAEPEQINGRLRRIKSGRVHPHSNILNFIFHDLRQH